MYLVNKEVRKQRGDRLSSREWLGTSVDRHYAKLVLGLLLVVQRPAKKQLQRHRFNN